MERVLSNHRSKLVLSKIFELNFTLFYKTQRDCEEGNFVHDFVYVCS